MENQREGVNPRAIYLAPLISEEDLERVSSSPCLIRNWYRGYNMNDENYSSIRNREEMEITRRRMTLALFRSR